MTQDDKKLEILLAMENSLLEASKLVFLYEFAFDIRSRVKFMMNLWKEFHGKPHHRAVEYGL
jgi:hypothetical protein